MIDISDGLLADLSHLLDGCGAEIRADRLPTSESLLEHVPEAHRRQALQLTGGSDYELLAVLPDDLPVPADAGGVPLTEIGRVTEADGIRCVDADGERIGLDIAGWDHFRADDR
jgi:thiamine-monophosphate kinase